MIVTRTSKIALITLFVYLLFASSALQAADDLSDRSINNAIEKRMLTDGGVRSHSIEVRTSSGIVTLSGSVDNILARDRAIEIARSINGVRSVVNMIEVEASERSDEEIRGDVKDALEDDPVTDALQIAVEVENGVVTLTGTVGSYGEKALCEQVVKGVKGVRDIGNKTEVAYKTKRSDEKIKADIRSTLRSNVLIDDSLIEIEVRDGNAKLKGVVGNPHERLRAEWSAWLADARSVDISDLKVDWSRRDEMRRMGLNIVPSDGEIRDAIRDAFSRDLRVKPFQIDVDVSNGSVAMTGTVDNLRAVRAAQEDAVNTFGVREVKNLLRVKPKVEIDDSKLLKDLSEAIMRDPYLGNFRLKLSVLDGKVTLSGSVESLFDKRRAEDVVSRVKGVVAVENNLKADYEGATARSDQEIKKEIEERLYWNSSVDSESIKVTVEDGVATLMGIVDSVDESRKAEELALYGGAKSVINNLKVMPRSK